MQDARRQLCPMAGEYRGRAVHRFTVFAASGRESRHQRGHVRGEKKIGLSRERGLAKKDKYLVGLDIGSTKTCVLIAEIEDGVVRFLALGAAGTKGLPPGLLIHPFSTLTSLR